MKEELRCLLRKATNKMSDAEREAQRESFVYGNVHMHNEDVTREMVAEVAAEMKENGELNGAGQDKNTGVGEMGRKRVELTEEHCKEAMKREILIGSDAARKLGLTRARVSQILDLLMLAPDIQEKILFMERVDGIEPTSERALRFVIRKSIWEEQRLTWLKLYKNTKSAIIRR